MLTIFSLWANSKCIVCHRGESHYLGKGEVLKRWQSTENSLDRTGHALIPAFEFKAFTRNFSAWSGGKKSFYSTMHSRPISTIAAVMREELHGYETLADELEKGNLEVLNVLKNPFHEMLLTSSEKKSYMTTIESGVQKVLLVFGGTQERMEGRFELEPLVRNEQYIEGRVRLNRWKPEEVASEGNFTLNRLGEVVALQWSPGSDDPLLQNCAWILQRPRDLSASPIEMERPIALETGRVIKQREMKTRLILDRLDFSRDQNGVFLDVSYQLEGAEERGQISILGGKGTARVNLRGILQSAHGRLELAVQAFGIRLKANMDQWIELEKD